MSTELETPVESPRRNPRRWVIIALVVLVCLALVVVGLVISLTDGERTARTDLDGAEPGPDEHIVSAPIEGRQAAELHLVSGANVVTVRTEDLGDTLYEVSTPPDGDSVPRTVERDDRIEVHLASTGRAGPSSVEIVLSTGVRWTALRLNGGANEQLVDLTGGRVAEIEFGAGASRIELTLPVPEGTVPVRVSAGAGTLAVIAPAGTPVRTTLTSGAGQAVIDGESHSGVGPGTTFTPDGWDEAEDRYDLDCAGLGELVVTAAAA